MTITSVKKDTSPKCPICWDSLLNSDNKLPCCGGGIHAECPNEGLSQAADLLGEGDIELVVRTYSDLSKRVVESFKANFLDLDEDGLWVLKGEPNKSGGFTEFCASEPTLPPAILKDYLEAKCKWYILLKKRQRSYLRDSDRHAEILNVKRCKESELREHFTASTGDVDHFIKSIERELKRVLDCDGLEPVSTCGCCGVVDKRLMCCLYILFAVLTVYLLSLLNT